MCGKRESLTTNDNDFAPFLWKGQTGEARQGWLP